MKILAMQFRYLGDAVITTPALRAIKDQFPDAALHVLVPQEIAPLFGHIPWLERVWAFPRVRGKIRLRQSWPVIRELRRERFDRSVDFGSGDRGAIMSLLCGAKERLAPFYPGGFLGRRYCFTRQIPFPEALHEVQRNLHVLSAWGIIQSDSLDMEIHADPALASTAAALLPRPAILCHLTTGQLKKEWPVGHWAELYRQGRGAGYEIVFSTGVSAHDQAVLAELKRLAPEAPHLPPSLRLDLFLAVIQRARLFVSGDTGPLHLAAGLGIPTISLFGPSSASRWAPLGKQHQVLQGGSCLCEPRSGICQSATPCMAAISSEAVLQAIRRVLPASPATTAGKAGA